MRPPAPWRRRAAYASPFQVRAIRRACSPTDKPLAEELDVKACAARGGIAGRSRISGQCLTRSLEQAALFRGSPVAVRADNGPNEHSSPTLRQARTKIAKWRRDCDEQRLLGSIER